ncbi:MAG: TIGR02996 domain-containing protein [Planctomycetes bacterium]|nr:TIGR02996 domain-containing protein [Planctomycetota bacterium]
MSPTKLPEWAAFQAAIVANPDDDTVRLVAADFLEENGDADRAAFIRIQVQLAQLEADGHGKSLEVDQLRAKERAFLGPLSMFRMLWAAEACPELVKMSARGGGRDPLEATTVDGVDRLGWRRGFVYRVYCSASEWQKHGPTLRNRLPITVVGLSNHSNLDRGLWWSLLPSLRGLRLLMLNVAGIPDEFIGWLRQQLPDVRVGAADTHSGGIDFPPRPQT